MGSSHEVRTLHSPIPAAFLIRQDACRPDCPRQVLASVCFFFGLAVHAVQLLDPLVQVRDLRLVGGLRLRMLRPVIVDSFDGAEHRAADPREGLHVPRCTLPS